MADDPADPPPRSSDRGDDYLLALAESERAVLVSGGKDVREQAATARRLRTQHDANRLRVDRANAADDGVELTGISAAMRADRVEREDEVPSGDRSSIAPARLGADAVCQCEGRLPGERDAGHEPRLERESPVDLERRLEDFLGDGLLARLIEDAET